jgi:hypothetical protein
MMHQIDVPFPRSYWIVPGKFLAGCYPESKDQTETRSKLEGLLDCGIRYFINLMEEDEQDYSGEPFGHYEPVLGRLAKLRKIDVFCERLSIRDIDIPTQETMCTILDRIDEALRQEYPVYVHCWGGIGRTGTVVGCYLVRHGMARGEGALKMVKELRQNEPTAYLISPETKEQRNFVRLWRFGM